jgi:hypothetical protein
MQSIFCAPETALPPRGKRREDLFNAIPTSMIMEELDPPRETFQLVGRLPQRRASDREYAVIPASNQENCGK